MTEEKCILCGKAPLSKDETGLTKKLIDKDAVSFYCLKCMSGLLEATQEELLIKIDEFRKEGCIFFR